MNFFLKLVLLRGEQRQLHMIINSIYCLLFPWLWFYKNYLFHWWCAWCLSVILLLWRNTFSGLIQIEARLNKSQQISAAYCVKNKIQIWFTCTFYFYLMPSYPLISWKGMQFVVKKLFLLWLKLYLLTVHWFIFNNTYTRSHDYTE